MAYFQSNWKNIVVKIDNQFHAFRLTSTFWTTCPEIRGKAIGQWLIKRKLAPWPYGNPPKVELVPLGGNRFRLKKI